MKVCPSTTPIQNQVVGSLENPQPNDPTTPRTTPRDARKSYRHPHRSVLTPRDDALGQARHLQGLLVQELFLRGSVCRKKESESTRTLVETSALLVVTGALLVGTRSY